MTQVQTQNKMGVMPINKLLLSMSLPMMISMLVQALYNIVDSMFVAQINENALTAVSLAFPIQNLMIAVASGTGIGVNALLSRYLGAKRPEDASNVAKNGILLSLLSFVVFAIFGIFGTNLFFRAQTDIAEIIEYGDQYLMVCSLFSFGIFGQILFERLLQSTGRTMYTMFTQTTGAIINIILDPILIFGLFGFPKMGVTGAAAATVFGQIVACILAIICNVKVNREISISLKNFRPSGETIKKIYAVGVPSIIMMSISSVMTFGMNKILMAFSSTATAVFGVYFKLQSFVFMPVFGLNNAMVPILAYNYGAKEKKRMTDTIKYAVLFAVSIMLAGLVLLQIFPAQLFMLFKASDSMLSIGVPALRIISLSFLFAGFCIIASSVFQALGNGFFSMLVSIIRQLVILLPAAYLLSLAGKVDLVWFSFPIAELASVALCLFFLRHTYHHTIKPVELEKAALSQN